VRLKYYFVLGNIYIGMKFILVKSIFCPTIEHFNTTVKSLVKINIFFDLIKKKHPDLDMRWDIYFVGWVDGFADDFESFLALYSALSAHNVYQDIWSINYGKYKIFNSMLEFVRVNNNYDFIIYLDHDIYFDFRSIDLFTKIPCRVFQVNGQEPGIVAFNQAQDTRHQPDIYENQAECDPGFRVIWPSWIGSIAGGGFVIYPDTMLKMENFETPTIYGLDDYWLVKKLNDLNFLSVVALDLWVIHPFQRFDSYGLWKKNHLLGLIAGKKSNYWQEVQESINFWNQIKAHHSTITIPWPPDPDKGPDESNIDLGADPPPPDPYFPSFPIRLSRFPGSPPSEK
jgi:hypothetical protein